MIRASCVLLLVLAACEPLPPGPAPTDSTDATDDTDAIEEAPFSELPAGEWTYRPVDGMICGNGADTGVGVNPGEDATKVVVVVQGGGACWDTASCYVLKTATHVESGWGPAQLESEARTLDASPFFDRSAEDNPWSDATFVLVPYCTGDLHAGRSEGRYDPLKPDRILHHHGDANMAAVSDLLAEQVGDAERAWVLGFSAGGYGAQLQADRFRDAFPDADLALMADGSPMVQPYDGRWGVFRSAWDMRLPDCEGCSDTLTDVLEARVDALPDARFGLITTRSDQTITLYFSYPLDGLAPAIDRLVTDAYLPDDRLQAFVVEGNEHVLLGNPARTGPGGVVLGDWFEAWRDDTEAWVDLKP